MPAYFRSTFTFDGKRYFCKGKTQREADQKAALKKADLEAGVVEASRKTVNAWWPEYLEVYHSRASETTLDLYRGIYKNSIAPFIGSRPLKSVRSVDLQRCLNNLSTKSQSYAKKAKILIVGLFKAAVDNDLLPKSPAVGLFLPETKPYGERRALTPAERSAFLDAAEASGHHSLFFLIIYHCGLRPSEVCRAQYEDYDRLSRTLHVRGQKTKAATRDVPVPAALQIPDGSGPMFMTARTGSAPTKKALRYWWRQITLGMEQRLGEPVASDLTPYCLRHDYCTRLQEAGVPIDIARRLMGHSSIEVTSKIYTHGTDKTLEIARQLIDKGAWSPVRRHSPL